ncbi:hypothetical protein [Hymenobacter rubidus]|uniref:hypothetical protein n=1 Tax=Hymenobacter rubidus TaxID=1441626 RepID=UPI00191CB039|nr:hypothetical protein [Hymenobacter rubidus]
MKYRLPFVVFHSLLGLWLLAALGSCSLYRKVFHPYRLPTPKPSPEYLAEQKKKKEQEKLRNDLAKASASTRKQSGPGSEEAATDISMPLAPAGDGGAIDAPATRSLPEKSTVRYDKHGLMKKPKLNRRKRHKVSKPFRPIQSIRDFFKYGLHAKPNYSPDHRPAPKQPSAEPDAAPEPTPDGKP